MTHHFASCMDCLDLDLLRYRAFAVIWHMRDGQPEVDAYRFADSLAEANRLVRADVPAIHYESESTETGQRIYDGIRRTRDEVDWKRAYALPVRLLWVAPWKVIQPGRYIARDDATYPCRAYAVERGRWRLSVLHVRICESAEQVFDFTRQVSAAHNGSFEAIEMVSTHLRESAI